MSGFISGLGGAAGSILGSAVSGAFALHGQNQAQKDTEYILQNRHQWQVQDLKKAGLNPILSAGGAPGGSGAVMGQLQRPDPVLAYHTARKLKAEADLAEAATEDYVPKQGIKGKVWRMLEDTFNKTHPMDVLPSPHSAKEVKKKDVRVHHKDADGREYIFGENGKKIYLYK